MLVRFLDDYAYQDKIRHSDINEKEVNDSIQPYVKTFSKLLGWEPDGSEISASGKRSSPIIFRTQ